MKTVVLFKSKNIDYHHVDITPWTDWYLSKSTPHVKDGIYHGSDIKW